MNHVFGELVGNGPKIGGLVSWKNSLTQFILQPLKNQQRLPCRGKPLCTIIPYLNNYLIVSYYSSTIQYLSVAEKFSKTTTLPLLSTAIRWFPKL